jgi:hypothetical protein
VEVNTMSTKEVTFAKNFAKIEMVQLMKEGRNVSSDAIKGFYEKGLEFYNERRDWVEDTGKA